MGQQQVQQSGQPPRQTQQRRQVPWKRIVIATIIVAFLLAFACVILWNLINMGVLHGAFFDTLSKILVAIGSAATAVGGVLTVYVGIAFSLKSFFTPSNEKTESPPKLVDTATAPPTSAPPSPPIIIQLQPQAPPTIPQPSPIPDKPISTNIIGSFPPTDPKTIQQRCNVVEQVYTQLSKPDTNCIVLTGIGGIGKSTVAALVYRHAEEQRKHSTTPFAAEALWLTTEATTSFADLAGMLSTALDKPIPDFGKLPPQQQAAALFYLLNTVGDPRLVVVNQFENLLNPQTGQATDPALGNLLDMLNSQPCRCRILLTGRRAPRGTYDFPPTRMQEYPIERLEMNEGIELLRKQGVEPTQATDIELRSAVTRCDGHALSLALLATILRSNRSLSLQSLFHNPTYAQLWTGNIARNLLDYIYERQLNDPQRKLLVAFSIYREPVPLEAAQAMVDGDAMTKTSGSQLDALNVLLAQHLLQDSGNECYQLHIIIANYAKGQFDTRGEQTNKQALKAAHAKAAQYYVQYAEASCPPRDKRRRADDVKPLIEAVWHYCQSGQWQEAYDLMRKEGLFPDLKRWGTNAILLELYQLLLPSDEWHPNSSQTAYIYNDLGWIYSDLGQKKQAQRCYEQALSKYTEIGDRKGEGTALNNLGLIYNILGKKEDAQKYFEQALDIQRELGDRKGEVRSLNNLGRVYGDLRQMDTALECFEQALTILKEAGVHDWEGRTLHNLGMVYEAMGQNWKALKYFNQALSIHKEAGDRGEEGKILNSLGGRYNALGQREEAIKYYERALSIHRDIGNRLWESLILNNLGIVYNAQWKKDTALKCFQQALDIEREVGNRGDEGITLSNIGSLYFEQGQYNVALACFLLARGIFEEVLSPDRDDVQRWIDALRRRVGEEQFATLLARVEPQAQHVVEQALRQGL